MPRYMTQCKLYAGAVKSSDLFSSDVQLFSSYTSLLILNHTLADLAECSGHYFEMFYMTKTLNSKYCHTGMDYTQKTICPKIC